MMTIVMMIMVKNAGDGVVGCGDENDDDNDDAILDNDDD